MAASVEAAVVSAGVYCYREDVATHGNNMQNNLKTLPRTPSGNVLLFARNFFRHPRMLGSIIPSSRFLIKQLLEPIDFARARVIVEYGPGVGGITTEVLRRMRPDGALIAIEMNPDFVGYLRGSISDRRLHVVEGSAVAVDDILRRCGFQRADYIISGIPFSTIPAPTRERILRKTRDALEPRGAFLVYQFSTRVLQDLKRIFGYVGRRFEPLNVLPAHLFICQPAAA
jgi:phospholipid N-methyltransferase